MFGDCDVDGNILFIINILDLFDVVGDINVFIDGNFVFGSLFWICDDEFVIINIIVIGDGLEYFVIVNFEDVGICIVFVFFLVLDCSFDCFLLSMSISM